MSPGDTHGMDRGLKGTDTGAGGLGGHTGGSGWGHREGRGCLQGDTHMGTGGSVGCHTHSGGVTPCPHPCTPRGGH